ncbi:Hypothetical predicted protein [Paramuricea clavata]|uniref:Uncharacterized protein n=1 Tax=Paramuricea clavata TaxID=317549 RepID=A0A6S7JZT1_PARCT|nr:Hypothetical predicted protein [Paramuricea clavata]
MERYTVLTDSIMYDILRNESGDPRMLEARKLLLKIQRRELYKFCGQTQPGSETDFPSESEIVDDLVSISEGALKAEQIFVSIVNIHFGMKHKDPVDAVVFYNKSYQPFKVRKEQVSQILPQKFHERYVRVYAKSREDSVTMRRCFEAWCSNKGYPVPHILEGDCTRYSSPAPNLIQGSNHGAVASVVRSLKL